MTEESYPKLYLYRRIVQSKLFIDSHYGENIDVECISDQACFSKFHFIRVFKSIYDKTPHQYLSYVRIEKAKELLKEPVPVTEVCFAVGFDSVSSFIALFKREVGLTPSAYQLQEHNRKVETSTVPLKFIPGCFAERNGSPKNSNSQEAKQ
jgi:AraC-like DNA-binding protein